MKLDRLQLAIEGKRFGPGGQAGGRNNGWTLALGIAFFKWTGPFVGVGKTHKADDECWVASWSAWLRPFFVALSIVRYACNEDR